MSKDNGIAQSLPGLDCGLCGFKTCGDFAKILVSQPGEIKKCIHLSRDRVAATKPVAASGERGCAACTFAPVKGQQEWKDSLGRDYDFILDTFPGEPGPRETIIPHNPLITKEMGVVKGDILIGRPLGISCGCPITHCGVVMDVDYKNGVMVWCVTGPLGPRRGAHKDIGYYSAEAYEGLVSTVNTELKIGMRYFFLPRRCMLQWRHSGLVNFINKTPQGLSIRIEGLWIG